MNRVLYLHIFWGIEVLTRTSGVDIIFEMRGQGKDSSTKCVALTAKECEMKSKLRRGGGINLKLIETIL